MPRTSLRLPRRAALSLLAAAGAGATGTLAAAPLLRASHVHRAPGTAASAALHAARAIPLEVPEPPTWPLLAAGLAGLGGAVALRRRLA